MKRKLKWVVFAVVAVSICGVGLWLWYSRQSAYRLPVKRTAMGATVVLKEVKRQKDGSVRIEVALENPAKVSNSVFLGDTILGRVYPPTTNGMEETEICFEFPKNYVPLDAKSLTVNQAVYRDRPSNDSIFIFNNISSGQRLTKAGHAAMIIRQVMHSAKMDNKKWDLIVPWKKEIPDGEEFFGIAIDRRLPYGCRITGVELKDNTGHIHEMTALYNISEMDETFMSWDAVELKATSLEKAVDKVSPKTANKLINIRASKLRNPALQNMTYDRCLYAYPPMGNTQKNFTLKITAKLPPDPKDVVWVRFENVPIK